MTEYAEFQAKADAGAAWANALSRKERATLARKLARACQRCYDARAGLTWPGSFDPAFGVLSVAAEMSELHMDVTERAAVPAA